MISRLNNSFTQACINSSTKLITRSIVTTPFESLKNLLPNTNYPNVLLQRFKKGNNVMHNTLMTARNANDIQAAIRKLGRDEAATLLKVPNNDGKLPYDLLEPKSFHPEELASCQTDLLELMKTELPPINEPINVDKILAQYYGADPAVYENVALACQSINETRSVLKYSASHPAYNQLSSSEQAKSYRLLYAVRNQCHYSFDEPDLPDLFFHVAGLVEKYQFANCHECSLYMMYLLTTKKLPEDFKASMDTYTNGDHVWNSFYTGPTVNITKKEFIQKSVVGDAWSGNVYLAIETDKYRDYRRFIAPDKTKVNVLTAYNPFFHKIRSDVICSQVKNNKDDQPTLKFKFVL